MKLNATGCIKAFLCGLKQNLSLLSESLNKYLLPKNPQEDFVEKKSQQQGVVMIREYPAVITKTSVSGKKVNYVVCQE